MRRIITAIALALALAAGIVAYDTAAPADAHPVSASTTRAICTYIAPPTTSYYLKTYHTVHYGTAHVTQCEFWQYNGYGYTCEQYVWNIPNPYWDTYKAGPIAGQTPPICW